MKNLSCYRKGLKIMYLWIGLGIDKENEEFIREYCKKINMKYKVNEQSFTLPQHISLKTSFDTEEYQNIINDFKNMFKNNKKMNLKVHDIEMVPGVIWLNIEEIPELRKYHNLILNHLKDKYNIEKIGFDGENFKFHSTLFQDVDNKGKVSKLYENIDKDILINNELKINQIYFGISEVGKVGTYKVVDYIELTE